MDAPEQPVKRKISLGPILGYLNTAALVGLLGVLVYTKILYKRPRITEPEEREKLVEEFVKAPKTGRRSFVSMEPMQANLKPTPIGVQVPGGPPQQMKAHYLRVSVALELFDQSYEPSVKNAQTKLQDKLLKELGGTSVDELATVQGRFLLRSKITAIANDLVREGSGESTPAVTNVYFSEFLVQ